MQGYARICKYVSLEIQSGIKNEDTLIPDASTSKTNTRVNIRKLRPISWKLELF